MKNVVNFLFSLVFIASCSSGSNSDGENKEAASTPPGKVEQSDPKANKGIGPVSSVELGEINPEMAETGKGLFNARCSACHKVEEKYIGPAIKGIMDRRSPEWIMNMILNPEEKVQKDAIAKKVYEEFNMAPMANMGLTQEETRSVLEYFRTVN